MKTIKVIYKGSSDEENFTYNGSYFANKVKDGLLTVLCDSGLLIEMQEKDFVVETCFIGRILTLAVDK